MIKSLITIALSFLTIAESSVHMFGDSHSMSSFCTLCSQTQESGFWSLKKNEKFIRVPFSIHHLGPITMHRIGRDGSSFLDIRKFGIKESDVIVFVFGEIDVRCHIGKQRDLTETSEEQILDTLVKNYFLTIQENRSFYQDLTCVIFNVIPPIDNAYVEDFGYYGLLEDRIKITKLLNTKLKNTCELYNFKFLDVYDFYAEMDGSLNLNLSDGAVHIGMDYNYFVKEQLNNCVSLETQHSEEQQYQFETSTD